MATHIASFVPWTRVGLLALALGLSGCSSHDAPPAQENTPSNAAADAKAAEKARTAEAAAKARQAAAQQAAAARAVAPAFSLSVAQLRDDYRKDARAADKKYRGQVVQIEAAVDDPFHRDLLGRRQVIVGTPEAALMLPQAACSMLEDEMPKVDLLWHGQKVKIKGRCQGGTAQPQLADCVLVEIGPSVPLLAVTADALLAAYRKEGQKANAQYKNKPLALSGVVDEVDALGQYVYVRGKTPLEPDDRRIRCRYAERQSGETENLRPGSPIELKGNCRGWWHLNRDIEVDLVHVVKQGSQSGG